MGNIDFRTGDLTGKLGGLVGARWKQSPYTRRYVVPANPRSDGQMAVRDSWAFLVAIGRRINSTVLKLFTLPKPKAMSAFNRFMQINKWFIDTHPDIYESVKISEGGLYILPITSIVASEATGTVVVNWPVTMQGEAKVDDIAIIIVLNDTRDSYGFSTVVERSVGTASVVLDGVATDEVHVWMFFVQGTELASISKYEGGEYVA
ncbi:hypothetical protein ES708_18168 [subsurface metagenome]